MPDDPKTIQLVPDDFRMSAKKDVPEEFQCQLCGARREEKNNPWCERCQVEYRRTKGWAKNDPAPSTPGAEYR